MASVSFYNTTRQFLVPGDLMTFPFLVPQQTSPWPVCQTPFRITRVDIICLFLSLSQSNIYIKCSYSNMILTAILIRHYNYISLDCMNQSQHHWGFYKAVLCTEQWGSTITEQWSSTITEQWSSTIHWPNQVGNNSNQLVKYQGQSPCFGDQTQGQSVEGWATVGVKKEQSWLTVDWHSGLDR